MDLLSIPYKSQGWSAAEGGIDCWTSTQILLERCGVTLDLTGWADEPYLDGHDHPEDSAQRISDGEANGPWVPVAAADICPMDIIMMDPDGIDACTHIGVYLGDRRVFHVTSAHGSQVVRMAVLLRKSGMVLGIRRVVHSQKTPGTAVVPVTAPTSDNAQQSNKASGGAVTLSGFNLLTTVRVHLMPSPLEQPALRTTSTVGHRPGMTVADLAPSGPGWDDWPGTVVAVVSDPGCPVILEGDWQDAVKLPEVWGGTAVQAGGQVVFLRLPGETTVVLLVIGLVISIVSAILQFVLTPGLDTAEQKKILNSPTFDLSGINNTAIPGIPIPVLYGFHKTGGNIISAFLTVDFQQRTVLNVIVCVSQGEIQSVGGITEDTGGLSTLSGTLNAANGLIGDQIPDGIQIDGNPASSYECEVFLRMGTNNQEPIANLSQEASTVPYDVTLFKDQPFTHVTAGNITRFALLITFPRGLYNVNTSNGAYTNRSVTFDTRYRTRPTPGNLNPAWTSLPTIVITNARRGQFSSELRLNVPIAAGRYEIEVTRTNPEWPETQTDHESQSILFGVTEYGTGQQSHPGLALVGYRIVATDQISGGLPVFTHDVDGVKVWVPDEPLNITAPTFGGPDGVKVWTDTPAWVLLDMILNPVYGMARGSEVDLNNVNLESFIEWKDLTETLVSDGRGGTIKRCAFNHVYDQDSTAWDEVVALVVSCWGRPLLVGDQITIVAEKPRDVDFMFNMTNVREFTMRYVGKNVRPTRVEAQFFNEEANFEADTAERPVSVPLNTQAPDRKETLRVIGCTHPAQAARMAQFRYNVGQRRRFAEWVSGLETIGLLPGDVIGFVHDAVEWGTGDRFAAVGGASTFTVNREVTLGSSPRVMFQSSSTDIVYERTISAAAATYPAGTVFTVTVAWAVGDLPQINDKWAVGEADEYFVKFRLLTVNIEQGMRRAFSAVEYVAADYTDDPGDVPTSTPALPHGKDFPAQVSDVLVDSTTVVNADGSVVDELRVWYKANRDWERGQVWYRLLDADGAEGTVDEDAAWHYAGEAFQGELTWTHNIAAGSVIEVSVLAVSPSGTRFDPRRGTRVLHEVQKKLGKPPGPLDAQLETTGVDTWLFKLGQPDIRDFAGFRITEGQTVAGGRILAACASDKQVLVPQDGFGSQPMQVNVVNKSGVLSFEGIDVSASQGLFTPYAVDVNQSEHGGWTGTKVNTQVTSSKLELVAGQLTGTYETGSITVTKFAANMKVLVNMISGIEEDALLLDECFFKLTDQQADRVLDSINRSGFELSDVTYLDDMPFTLDSEYATLFTGEGMVDVIAGMVPLVEIRTSSNGGSSWTDWEPFIPLIRFLDVVQIRLTLNRPSETWNPRMTAMNTILATL